MTTLRGKNGVSSNFSSLVVIIVMLFLPFSQTFGATTATNRAIVTVDDLNLEQKVGQLFIFGYAGTKLTSRLKNKLRKLHPGALITFKRNIKSPAQISSLNHRAQKFSLRHSKVPLLIMVDQEGGSVTRIKTRPHPPSALAIGMAKSNDLAFKVGEVTGEILRHLGFNQNLAPVADLSNPFGNNFIGNRSYGQDPDKVKEMVSSVAQGLLKASVLPTIKHYPGHGGIIQDSHRQLPEKLLSESELVNKDLVPFRKFINSIPISATMVAHISFPNIDPSGQPATYSKPLVDALLRKRLGFPGIIITDDVEMEGARSVGLVGERAIRALEAGNDMIMVAWSLRKQFAAYRAVLGAVRSGRLSINRVNQSVERILQIKQRLKIARHPKRFSRRKFETGYKKLITKLKGITNKVTKTNLKRSLRGYSYLEGTLNKDLDLNVFSADYAFFKQVQKSFAGRSRFIPLRKGVKVNFRTVLNTSQAQGIYYVSGTGTARYLNGAPRALKSQLIVINTGYPGLIPHSGDYKAVININSRNYLSGKWIAQFLQEKPSPKLRLPAKSNMDSSKRPAQHRIKSKRRVRKKTKGTPKKDASII